MKSTYAFWRLDILLDYATYALVFRAHVLADAVQLDRVAETHLALWVHEAIFDKLLAYLGSLGFDLCILVLIRETCAAVLTC
jgi:hypothetical protein